MLKAYKKKLIDEGVSMQADIEQHIGDVTGFCNVRAAPEIEKSHA